MAAQYVWAHPIQVTARTGKDKHMILDALGVMALGMLGIFLVMGLVIGSITLLNHLAARKTAAQPPKADDGHSRK